MDRKSAKGKNTRPDLNKKRIGPSSYRWKRDASFASTSAQKLKKKRCAGVPINPNFAYCILEFVSVFTAISNIVICKDCRETIRFSQSCRSGAGFTIVMRCKCSEKSIHSCPKINNKAYEVNRRLIFVLRLLGVDLEGFNKFCGLMDISCGIAKKRTMHVSKV